MKRDIRPKGREKNVTEGGGNVFRRGDGIDVNDGQPVGDKGGYAERGQDSFDNRAAGNTPAGNEGSGNQGIPDLLSGLSELIGSSTSGGQAKKRASNQSGKLKKILIIAGVIIIGYFVISSLFSDKSNEEANPISNNGIGGPSISGSDNNSIPLNTTVSVNARAKRTVIKGNGEDIFTIMVYMCGSDLESDYGMATADLNEILHSTISDKVNIIVETGGASSWQNSVISNTTNQRYKCTNKGLLLLQDDLGIRAMTEPETLSDFIRYCKSNFSANRYALILWDHGGGSINGFGYDQNAPNSSMTLDKINSALKNADCQFDFIGFDACLMATLENAIMLSNYSDYMIASEETEPAKGWYYTNWITALSGNTSMSTPQIGKLIIDDFISSSYETSPQEKSTLSIIDLAELSGTLPETFRSFASSTGKLVESANYQTVSDARGNAKEFAQSAKIDQVDLINLAENLKTEEAAKLISVLKQCIKYNRTSNSINNANGVSIYFPYEKLSGLGNMLYTYDKIGMDSEYSSCIKSFANLESGGQIVTSGSPNALSSLQGGPSATTGADLISSLLSSFIQGGDFSSIIGSNTGDVTSWFDTAKLTESVKYYQGHYLDSKKIMLTEKNGGYVLSLSNEDWELVQNINLNVFADDGSGYIDLGLDNVFEFDNDGDLLINFDGTWLAINGQVVSYYFLTEDDNGDGYTITGRVPALLNGQLVDLILVFDNNNPNGLVLGARINYAGKTGTVAKGLIGIKDGDVIDFLCDYYAYNGQYDKSYYLGNQLVVNGGLNISNVSIGDMLYKATYKLIDIYNNTYWTPSIDSR